MRRVTLPVRGVGPREADYEPHELGWAQQTRALLDSEDAGLRSQASNELLVVHELKALLGARMLTDKELEQRGEEPAPLARAARPTRSAELEVEQIQTTLLPPDGTTGMFQIPDSVKRRLGVVEDDYRSAPNFDGATIVQDRDKPRLFPQLQRVGEAMKDGRWHTLEQVSNATGDPQASISARLRDLRKPKFGMHEVERRYVSDGLHEYRLVLNPLSAVPVGYADPDVSDDEEAASA